MKKLMREIHTDLRAAAALGHPDSVAVVLESLIQVPQFSGNHRLEEHFVIDQLIPLGELVAKSTLDRQVLLEMLDSSTTIYRAIAAVSLLRRWAEQQDDPGEYLLQVAGDPRPEVREAVIHSLRNIAGTRLEDVLGLIKPWVESDSNRLRLTITRLLPAVYSEASEWVFEIGHRFSVLDDYEINRALVDTLNEIAHKSYGREVLASLESWSNKQDANIWVICRVFGAPWVVQYADQATQILQVLEAAHGRSESIEKAYQTLQTKKGDTDNS